MLHEHTHTTRKPPSSPGPPWPISSDSSSGQYEPRLILYPYRRGSSSSISSLSLIPVLRGLGREVKRSGRLFVGTKASKIKVSVADISKPSSLDPPEISFGLIEGETKVVAHSNPEPASTIVAHDSEATIMPPRTTETLGSSSTSDTAADGALSDTPVNGLIVDDQVPLPGESSHLRSNNLIITVLKAGPKNGDISRLHVLKQTFATIGRSLPMKSLRLPEKVKETSKETRAFMSQGIKSSVIYFDPGELAEDKSGYIRDNSVQTNIHQPDEVTPSEVLSSLPDLYGANVPGGSSTAMPEDPDVGDLFSNPSELTMHPLFRGDVARDSFVIDSECSLVNEPVDARQGSSSNSSTSSDICSAVPSIPIFKQRPSSGEYNRKDVFRKISALVQAPAFKPLSLKRTDIVPHWTRASSGADHASLSREVLYLADESESKTLQSNVPPSNSGVPGPSLLHSSATVSQSSSATTYEEITELFEVVEDLYPTPISPKDPISRPDDLITDADAITQEAAPVSRPAGSRPGISVNFNANNIEENEATLVSLFEEYLSSWQNAFGKASAMTELAPVRPLRIIKKAKRSARESSIKLSRFAMGEVKAEGIKRGDVERNNVKIGQIKSLTVESSIVKASVVKGGLVASICEVVDFQSIDTRAGLVDLEDQPGKVKSVAAGCESLNETTQAAELAAVLDLYVSAYEDLSMVIVRTPGRKSQREGLDRDLLYTYHTFRAPQPPSNQEPETIQSPLDSSPCFILAPVPDGQVDVSADRLTQPLTNEALIGTFWLDDSNDDNSDYSVDCLDAESDTFEYNYITNESSQGLSTRLDQSDNKEQAVTRPPLESMSAFGATTNPGLAPAPTQASAAQAENSDQTQRHEALVSALLGGGDDDGFFDYSVDFFDAESDPFKHDLNTSKSSQILSNLAKLDKVDNMEDDDSYGLDPFKYSCLLGPAYGSIKVLSPKPELEYDSAISSPESTIPTTLTSIDLPLSALLPAELANKIPESHGPDVYWTWDVVDKVDDDRDGAIGAAL
ncbi:hypothetical protein FRC07_004444 [Ceratobasidium sp. 392]|nr:hypothetical protein FRC07_004444 [Ceratobasidium sp. 392]